MHGKRSPFFGSPSRTGSLGRSGSLNRSGSLSRSGSRGGWLALGTLGLASMTAASGRAEAQAADVPVPRVTAADRARAFPDLGGMDVRKSMPNNPYESYLLVDQLEQATGKAGAATWDMTAWTGRNFNRLWLRSEGDRQSGDTERAELQVLYGRTIAPWWDLVGGVREDFRPSPSRGWAAFGIQGLAPYRFDLEATAFAGSGGRAAARVKAEYELLMTERWVLQPHVELNWYAQDEPRYALGAGFATAEVGLRLRYEFRHRVAPYVGVVAESKHGATARYARAEGAEARDTRYVFGVRFWF